VGSYGISFKVDGSCLTWPSHLPLLSTWPSSRNFDTDSTLHGIQCRATTTRLQIYGNIMRYRTFESEIWDLRPWCPKRFPAQPHCPIAEGYNTSGPDGDGAVSFMPVTITYLPVEDCYTAHQDRCSRIRKVMDRNRNVLQYPGRWRDVWTSE